MSSGLSSISYFEKRAILVVSLFASLFVVYVFVDDAMYWYRDSVHHEQVRGTFGIEFSHDEVRQSPGGLLLVLPLITVALIRPKRFWISAGLTAVCLGLFVIGCYFRIQSARSLQFIRPVWDAFYLADYIFASYLVGMMIWQLSILWRISPSRQLR